MRDIAQSVRSLDHKLASNSVREFPRIVRGLPNRAEGLGLSRWVGFVRLRVILAASRSAAKGEGAVAGVVAHGDAAALAVAGGAGRPAVGSKGYGPFWWSRPGATVGPEVCRSLTNSSVSAPCR